MENKPIHVFATWQVKAGSLGNVLSLLTELAKESRNEPGNLHYNVHQDNSDPNKIVLYEGYRDQAALDAHRNSPHFQTLVLKQIVPDLETRQVVLASLIDQ